MFSKLVKTAALLASLAMASPIAAPADTSDVISTKAAGYANAVYFTNW